MRAKIRTNEVGWVIVEYDFEDYNGPIRIERTFSCPPDGGYVLERYPNGQWKQVCERLAGMGNTLSCSSRDELLPLIRREYRAMRRIEKREAMELEAALLRGDTQYMVRLLNESVLDGGGGRKL